MAGNTSQILYVMLALPTLFGLTLVGEGMYKISHYEHGWGSIFLGCLFLMVVAGGYFYLKDLI
jgi:hypothetical protein